MTRNLTVIIDEENEIGECPLWDSEEKCLYWTDIPEGMLYRHTPETGTNDRVFRNEDGAIGGFTLQTDGSKVLFEGNQRIEILRDGETEPIVEGESDAPRFNDVAADPAGGVFCGTMPEEGEPGKLYRLSPAGELNLVLDGLGVPNGIGFSPDGQWMYFTESTAHRIYRFEFDPETAELRNRETFAEISDEEAYNEMPSNMFPVPDGLTVDEEGFVWSVLFGGEGIVRFTPEGREDRRIESPVKTSTSLAFGGQDFRELYVTTGRIGQRDLGVDDPDAGAVLSTTLTDVVGRPPHRSEILV